MAGEARAEMAVETLNVVADRGYYESEELRACEQASIPVTLPKPLTSGAKAAGRFGKQDLSMLRRRISIAAPPVKLRWYADQVERIWQKWLSRRDRGSRLLWSRFTALLKRHPLPAPRSSTATPSRAKLADVSLHQPVRWQDAAPLLDERLSELRAQSSVYTTGPQRRISRWEHEAVLERVQQRLDQDPNKMTLRRQTAEHPFGTIKDWRGATHFLM
jgi:hypothetical protein